MKYSLYTDGASRNNPGIAAVGGVIKDEGNTVVCTFYDFIGIATNNVAEYTALIKGLELALQHKISDLGCYLDSELVVKQLNGEYKVKDRNLAVLNNLVRNLLEKFNSVEFFHVPREQNKEADRLVNKALDALN